KKGGEQEKKQETMTLLKQPEGSRAQDAYEVPSGAQVYEGGRMRPDRMMQGPEGMEPSRTRILHLSLKGTPRKRPQTVDSYVPSATHARGILLSGLAVSTALSTQSDPQPIMIRLLDHGTIPGGFSSNVKDAVLIGACHGELS